MSVFRSYFLTVEKRCTSGNRKALHPCAAVSHVHHFDHVFQRIVYSFVYIAELRLELSKMIVAEFGVQDLERDKMRS